MFTNRTIKTVFAVLFVAMLFTCAAPAMAGGPVNRIWVGWTQCPRKVGVVTSANSYPLYQTGYMVNVNGQYVCERGKPNAWESAKDASVRARYAATHAIQQGVDDFNNAYNQGARIGNNAQCVVRNDFGQCIR